MVISIGEILVDMFMDGDSTLSCPGGAPFNVACNIAHWDRNRAGFLGCVGKDHDGDFLLNEGKKRLTHCHILQLDEFDTTQAIVTLKDGERSFRFNRAHGADYQMGVEMLENLKINAVIYHFGSLMLSEQVGRDFFYEGIRFIRKQYPNAKISFDVNYRDDIFASKEEAMKIYLDAIKEADILKFTEEELTFLSGKNNIIGALKALVRPDQIAVVTFGKDGSALYVRGGKLISRESVEVKPIDTTGAGDAFYAYFLYELDKGLDVDDVEAVREALKLANIVGACATQRKGAIDVVPTLDELKKRAEELYH